MSPWRVILAIIFPPFSVLDKGCGVAMIVFLLTIAGWIPGVIAALLINAMSPTNDTRERRFVEVPVHNGVEAVYEKPKRKGAYVRLADGEVAEVIDDEDVMPDIEKLKRNPY